MTKSKRPLRFSLLFASLAVLVIIAAGAWSFFGESIRERWSREQFDSAAWEGGRPHLHRRREDSNGE